MAVSKGISGGYLPLAATLSTEEVYQGFLGKYEEFKTFFHGHTYTGNPQACAAAIASLEVFEEEKVLEQLQPKIRKFSERLEAFKALPHVGDVRQMGIMIGIELVSDGDKANTPGTQGGHGDPEARSAVLSSARSAASCSHAAFRPRMRSKDM